ncbi:MAG: cellulase family glycosylhydrolase [Pseudomonadota bacterium]
MFARCCYAIAFLFSSLTIVNSAVAETAFRPMRGISMDLWVTWPAPETWNEPKVYKAFPEWRKFVSDDELTLIKRAGLDTVRLPIEPAFLLYDDDPERLGVITAGIKIAIDRLIAEDFNVIVDFHTISRDHPQAAGTEQIIDDPATFDTYIDLVGFIAAQLRHYPQNKLALELLNEPTHDCDQRSEQALWQNQTKQLYKAVRNVSPERWIILSGACWGSADGLAAMSPSDFGPHTIWSFHAYDPFAITHQGAQWTGDLTAHLSQIPYPPYLLDDAELSETVSANVDAIRRGATRENQRDAIGMLRGNLGDANTPRKLDAFLRRSFEKVAQWADRHAIERSRIFLGEFGMIGREYGTDLDVPDAWRITYMRDMITLAEEYDYAWSVWSFGGAFGLVQAYGGETLERPLVEALTRSPLN